MRSIENGSCWTWLTVYGGDTYGSGSKVGGVAPYAAELARAISSQGVPLRILAQRGAASGARAGVTVEACWSPGDVWSLTRALMSRRINALHVQHELFMYGGGLAIVVLPLLLLWLAFTGTRIIVTLHGVIALNDLDDAFCRRFRVPLPSFVVKLALILVFRWIARASTELVVHDAVFASRLREDYRVRTTVVVIPHLLPPNLATLSERAENRRKAILFFGFVAAYKGLDTLVEAYKRVVSRRQDVRLVVAGGAHPKHRNDVDYITKYEALRSFALRLPNVEWRGYVDDEDELHALLSAADLMVLPYTTLLSMSGPLNFAAQYGIRVLCSDIMSPLLPADVPVCETSPDAFADAIEAALASPPPLSFKSWRRERSPEKIAARFRALYLGNGNCR